jgi:hypothetical protein
MRRTVVWLTDPQVKALTRASKESLAPVSALVRRAVEEFLRKRGDNHKPKAGQRRK